MEADEQAKNYASEHLGVNTRENCHRCHNSGVQDKSSSFFSFNKSDIIFMDSKN